MNSELAFSVKLTVISEMPRTPKATCDGIKMQIHAQKRSRPLNSARFKVTQMSSDSDDGLLGRAELDRSMHDGDILINR